MYGISTEYKIAYIDCLFNCMSAMTVTGLATINLSTLSATQQALLFVQMTIGSPVSGALARRSTSSSSTQVFVSLLMIMVRQHFFRSTFKEAIRAREERKKSFSLSRTMSRITPQQPFSTMKRKFSMNLPKTKTQEVGFGILLRKITC